MAEPRCPNCSEPVQPGFRVCPYCAAPLVTEPATIPTARLAPAEQEGRRDVGRVGVGLLVLGLLGFVGVILALMSGARFDPESILTIGGGAIVMVITGSAMVGGRQGGSVATGVLGSCASALMATALGFILAIGMIVYMIHDCLKACSGPQPSTQQKR